MSSGEILFILAFIVLPTAVLVSSAWAILFIRRRPEQGVAPSNNENAYAEPPASDQFDVVVDTVVLPTLVAPDESIEDAHVSGAAASDQLGEVNTPETELPEPVIAETDIDEDNVLTAPVSTTENEIMETDQPDSIQTTDDLNDVVAKVIVIEQENEASALDGESPEHDDEPEIYETTDLPLIKPGTQSRPTDPSHEPLETSTTAVNEPDEDSAHNTQDATESRWRRRKRPAPLRPGDSEGGRSRGRNRDPQRQVPQLGRAARKRDTQSDDDTPNSGPG